jgi:uridine kinase
LTSAHDSIVAEIQRLLTARSTRIVVALDGRSGAGKSTLAASVARAVDGGNINVDDFSTGEVEGDPRAIEAIVADAIDWRRLRAEALEPLLAGRIASWHPFDFIARKGLDSRMNMCAPAQVVVLDGLYSARSELSDLLGLRVLVEAPTQLRARRLAAREGTDFMRIWQPIWDAREDYYFSFVRPRDTFDLIVISDPTPDDPQ